ACLEYLLRLGERLEPAFMGQLRDYPRERRRLKIALEAARSYEAEISRQVLAGLSGSSIQLFGVTDSERVGARVPTFAFASTARDTEVERTLWEVGRLQVAAGSHYSAAVTRGL